MNVSSIFLFAHEDDEVFIAPKIRELASGGYPPYCYIITRNKNDTKGEKRAAESIACLEKMGIPNSNVVFIGKNAKIYDEELSLNLDKALEYLLKEIGKLSFDFLDIYTPAWEGGHPDHDSCCLIAAGLKKHLGFPCKIWQFYLYNGFRTWGPIFKISNPIRNRDLVFKKMTWVDIFYGILDPLRYRSQLRSWIFLYPIWLITILFERKIALVNLDVKDLALAPHEGKLLYERHGRTTYKKFFQNTESFSKTIQSV